MYIESGEREYAGRGIDYQIRAGGILRLPNITDVPEGCRIRAYVDETALIELPDGSDFVTVDSARTITFILFDKWYVVEGNSNMWLWNRPVWITEATNYTNGIIPTNHMKRGTVLLSDETPNNDPVVGTMVSRQDDYPTVLSIYSWWCNATVAIREDVSIWNTTDVNTILTGNPSGLNVFTVADGVWGHLDLLHVGSNQWVPLRMTGWTYV